MITDEAAFSLGRRELKHPEDHQLARAPQMAGGLAGVQLMQVLSSDRFVELFELQMSLFQGEQLTERLSYLIRPQTSSSNSFLDLGVTVIDHPSQAVVTDVMTEGIEGVLEWLQSVAQSGSSGTAHH